MPAAPPAPNWAVASAGTTGDELVAGADRNMYEAKVGGGGSPPERA
jgi:hypothetical protein